MVNMSKYWMFYDFDNKHIEDLQNWLRKIKKISQATYIGGYLDTLKIGKKFIVGHIVFKKVYKLKTIEQWIPSKSVIFEILDKNTLDRLVDETSHYQDHILIGEYTPDPENVISNFQSASNRPWDKYEDEDNMHESGYSDGQSCAPVKDYGYCDAQSFGSEEYYDVESDCGYCDSISSDDDPHAMVIETASDDNDQILLKKYPVSSYSPGYPNDETSSPLEDETNIQSETSAFDKPLISLYTSELDTIKTKLKNGVNDATLADDHFELWCKYHAAFKQYRLLNRLSPRKPEVHVYFGPNIDKILKAVQKKVGTPSYITASLTHIDGYDGYSNVIYCIRQPYSLPHPFDVLSTMLGNGKKYTTTSEHAPGFGKNLSIPFTPNKIFIINKHHPKNWKSYFQKKNKDQMRQSRLISRDKLEEMIPDVSLETLNQQHKTFMKQISKIKHIS